MKQFILVLFNLLLLSSAFAQKKPLLNLHYEENYTPTYYELVEMYQKLDAQYKNAVLLEKGLTDSGKPLHLFVINSEPEFNPAKIKSQDKSILLINNGIHAGEPAGIDASLQFADDILRNKNNMATLLENTVVLIIPTYNIGGLIQRSVFNRANQTTPAETGFRGNAANLDLNRDFVKCDSENAKSFTKIFHEWDPDVFLDTHTTNGSDHQYSITLIAPQPDLFPAVQENFLREKMLPELYKNMENGDYELIPYVSWMYPDPKMGIKMTQESPRYSSGYASLFNSYGMMTENHVYKAYPDRVKSCYQFIKVLANFTANNSTEIIESRKKGTAESVSAKKYPVTFELDTTVFREIKFRGYEVEENQLSQLTGLPRFGYNRSRPYTSTIKFFDAYNPVEEIKIPNYYILPQAWKPVVERLILNNIEFSILKNDTILMVEVDYIESFSSSISPYNGHFYHSEVITKTETQQVRFYAGDLVVPTKQKAIKYIIEMLEPKAADSFFRWNFFDSILDQREYFSDYGYEENALKYLKEYPEFKNQFQEKQKNDAGFAANHRAQLAYIYENTEWKERTFKRYPAARVYID